MELPTGYHALQGEDTPYEVTFRYQEESLNAKDLQALPLNPGKYFKPFQQIDVGLWYSQLKFLLPLPNREAGFFYLEFCKGADFLRKDSTIIEICIKYLEKKQEMKLLINLSSLSAFTDVNAVFLGKIDFRPGIYRLMYQTPGSPRIQPTQIKEAKFYDFAKSKYLILEE